MLLLLIKFEDFVKKQQRFFNINLILSNDFVFCSFLRHLDQIRYELSRFKYMILF